MTAKQRAARARFKAAVLEAKKLRKKNPKITQAQALKQAFAISYSKKRAGKKLGETHKDTKSHNVNIRVVSGIKKKKKIGSAYLDRLKEQQAKAEREREAERTKRQRPAAASKRVREVLKRQGLKMPSGYKVAERVISGIGEIGEKFTRVSNDINGNPRYVVHFLEVLNDEERTSIPFNKKYEYALKKAKKIGGKKYDNKSYGGGIVFQSYNIEKTYEDIQKLKNTMPKIRIYNV